jgi:predicted  nucleic acid-binding Zn-ribbon protein
MKKFVFTLMAAAVCFASCDGLGGGNKSLQAKNDSLMAELNSRDAELDDMMGTFNQITEGFRQISEAENRVDLQRGSIREGSASAKQQIASDIEFIKKTMQDNREQIEKLNAQLATSKNQNAQLKKAVESFTKQLEAKAAEIASLQEELMAKNIRIQELDEAVSELTAVTEDLHAENMAKTEVMEQQDRALNTAWFVFGTKSELKEQKILTGGGLFKNGELFSKGEVLKSGEANLDYFTECDIRTTKEIRLYSKSATLLTSHPANSYTLDKDEKGELTLNITNPTQFWSASKYLVIQVK